MYIEVKVKIIYLILPHTETQIDSKTDKQTDRHTDTYTHLHRHWKNQVLIFPQKLKN